MHSFEVFVFTPDLLIGNPLVSPTPDPGLKKKKKKKSVEVDNDKF